jgi:hypothetical protein
MNWRGILKLVVSDLNEMFNNNPSRFPILANRLDAFEGML